MSYIVDEFENLVVDNQDLNIRKSKYYATALLNARCVLLDLRRFLSALNVLERVKVANPRIVKPTKHRYPNFRIRVDTPRNGLHPVLGAR